MLRIVSFVIALSMVTTPALAEEIIMKCPKYIGGGHYIYKYSNPPIGSREVYYREDGGWRKYRMDGIEHGKREVKDRGLECEYNDELFYQSSVLDFVALTATSKVIRKRTKDGTTTWVENCKRVN